MQKIEQMIMEICRRRPEKLVISNPSADAKFRKLRIALKFGKGGAYYQIERLTGTQAFHENIAVEELPERITEEIGAYRQLDAWAQAEHLMLKRSKRGQVSLIKRAAEPIRQSEGHDAQKRYLLKEGMDIPPLVDLGVFTAQGKIVRTMYDKFKQINRFVELIDDAVGGKPPETLTILDFGCGKSYLTFILFYFLTQVRGINARITGLDLKADVVANCNAIAKKYGYEGLKFAVGDIAGFECDRPIDMVLSLHACDTATDDALYSAICRGAEWIFCVPCCQHELNAQMEGGALRVMTEYGVIKERTAALLTDALRAGLLTYSGYKTQVLEFIDIAHSPKNLMIRAKRANISGEKREAALLDVERAMGEMHVSPALYRLLMEQG